MFDRVKFRGFATNRGTESPHPTLMSAKTIVTVIAIVVVVAVASFAVWISATVGDPRVGNPTSTIVTASFVALIAGLVGYSMYRDR